MPRAAISLAIVRFAYSSQFHQRTGLAAAEAANKVAVVDHPVIGALRERAKPVELLGQVGQNCATVFTKSRLLTAPTL